MEGVRIAKLKQTLNYIRGKSRILSTSVLSRNLGFGHGVSSHAVRAIVTARSLQQSAWQPNPFSIIFILKRPPCESHHYNFMQIQYNRFIVSL